MIPKLTRQQIEHALSDIMCQGVPKKRYSAKHCLVYNGRHFPPKYVVSLAVPGGLDPSEFSGGPETNTVLADLGFHVSECTCGGAGWAAEDEAAVAYDMPTTQPGHAGLIVTGCIESAIEERPTEGRLALLQQMLLELQSQTTPFLLILPGGYFNSLDAEPTKLCRQIGTRVAKLLKKAPIDSTVCVGVDGQDMGDQLALAITREGIIAKARKFFPAAGEEEYLTAADSPWELEDGLPRHFTFCGRQYYLAVCYDCFGIRKAKAPNLHADAIITLVHGFDSLGSGAGYFARYGLVGAAKVWECPVYAAAFFEGRFQPNWPSAVRWNRGDLDTRKWRYGDNPLAPERTISCIHGSETAWLALYE